MSAIEIAIFTLVYLPAAIVGAWGIASCIVPIPTPSPIVAAGIVLVILVICWGANSETETQQALDKTVGEILLTEQAIEATKEERNDLRRKLSEASSSEEDSIRDELNLLRSAANRHDMNLKSLHATFRRQWARANAERPPAWRMLFTIIPVASFVLFGGTAIYALVKNESVGVSTFYGLHSEDWIEDNWRGTRVFATYCIFAFHIYYFCRAGCDIRSFEVLFR